MHHRARARYMERLTKAGALEVVQSQVGDHPTCVALPEQVGFSDCGTVPRPKARQVTATDISAAIRFPLFLALGTLNKA